MPWFIASVTLQRGKDDLKYWLRFSDQCVASKAG
jgi:hypothetical protein